MNTKVYTSNMSVVLVSLSSCQFELYGGGGVVIK